MLHNVAKPFVRFVERYYPDPFVFAALATLVTFILALALTDASPTSALGSWGDGLGDLMTFIGQLSLTLLASHALAHTRPVLGLLNRLASVPRSASATYATTFFIAGVSSLISWALGLVVGGLFAQRMAVNARSRALRVHYPLLVASGYSGFVVWHMGYSGSAQLFVATPGHALEQTVGIVPVTDTLLQPYNIGAALLLLFTLSLVMAAMKPRLPEVVELPADLEVMDVGDEEETDATSLTPAQQLERQRWITVLLGSALTAYLISYWMQNGLDLNLNIVNWSFLALGLLLVSSPIEYVRLIASASKIVGQIILQYPFYAGIMGIMMGTGLVKVIAGWFIAISSQATLAFWAFLAGGIVNVFVPSGGGQWSIQGPIFIEAARELDVSYGSIVNGVAWGDQWTNMVQPIWTIPVLAIAGLKVRHIMGYTFITLIVSGIIFSSFLLMFAR